MAMGGVIEGSGEDGATYKLQQKYLQCGITDIASVW